MNKTYHGDAKRHYKMFKAGKKWMFMAITTFAIAGGATIATAGTTYAADGTTDTAAAATATASSDSNAPAADDNADDTAPDSTQQTRQDADATDGANASTGDATATDADDSSTDAADDSSDAATDPDAATATDTDTDADSDTDTSDATDDNTVGITDNTANLINQLAQGSRDAAAAEAANSADDSGTTGTDADATDTKAPLQHPQEVTDLMAKADTNGDGTIDTADFSAADEAASNAYFAKFKGDHSAFTADPELLNNSYVLNIIGRDAAQSDTVTISAPENDTLLQAIATNNGTAEVGTYAYKNDDGSFEIDFANGASMHTKEYTGGAVQAKCYVYVGAGDDVSAANRSFYWDTMTYDETDGLFHFTDQTDASRTLADLTGTFNPITGIVVYDKSSLASNGQSVVAMNYLTGEQYMKYGYFNFEGNTLAANQAAEGTTSISDQLTKASSYWLKQTGDYDKIDTSSAGIATIIAAYDQAKKDYDDANPQAMSTFTDSFLGFLTEFIGTTNASVDDEAQKWFGDATPPLSLNYLQQGDIMEAWDNGYRGEGMVVAVIDNGVDEHSAMRLTDDDTAAISEDDADAIIAKLGYGTYVSDKIPFAYNYSDNDDQATNTYSVDHGEHVAGIIAANDEISTKKSIIGSLFDAFEQFGAAINATDLSDMITKNPALVTELTAVLSDDKTITKLADVMDGMTDDQVDQLGAYVLQNLDAATSDTSDASTTDADRSTTDAPTGNDQISNLLKEAMAMPTATLKPIINGLIANVDPSTVDQDELSSISSILKKVRDGEISQNVLTTAMQQAEKALSGLTTSDTADGTSSTGSTDTSAADLMDTSSDDYSVGVAPEAQILDMRVISSGQWQEATTIYKAIHDAVDMGADVINMSIGGGYTNDDAENIFEQAVKYATDNGVFVAISAANSGERANVGAAGGDEYDPEIAQTLANPGTSPTATTVAAEGSMNIDDGMKTLLGNISAEVAYFSSWGPESDFTLKPDVTAPGVSLTSTMYNDQYQSMSGTSMASPYIAGVATLVEQRLKQMGFTGEQLSEYTKLAVMNSATVLEDSTYNTAISPRHQGAGQVDAEAATDMTVAASATNAKDGNVTGSVSLYNVDKSKDFSIDFTNYGDTDVTYTFDAGEGVLTSVYDTDDDGNLTGTGYTHDIVLDGASVTAATPQFTIKAGESKTLNFTLSFDDSVPQDEIAEGFLHFTSDQNGTNDIVVPFLAYHGDLTDEQVFSEIEDAGVASYLANEDGLPLGIGSSSDAVAVLVANGDTNYANGGSTNDADALTGAVQDAVAAKAAISPNGDGASDTASPIIYSSQNLEKATVQITDANGNVLRTIDTENNLDASGINEIAGGESQDFADLSLSYSMAADDGAFKWDGQLYDQKTGKFYTAPDGQYYFKVTGELEVDGANKEQSITLPITIDTKAPTITGAAFDASTDSIAFSYADAGIGFTKYTNATININGKDEIVSFGNDGTTNNGTFNYTLTAADIEALGAGDGNITISFADAAGNVATTTIASGYAAGQSAATTDADATAPTFQFYLPQVSAGDKGDVNAATVSSINFSGYGFDTDSYTTPYERVASDTATLKAHVTNYTAGTKFFVRDLPTGDVFTATAAPDANGDIYFNVDNIEQAVAQMPNMLSAIFVGYAITPTDETGVYKESLKDSIALMWSDTATSDPAQLNDTTTVSPFSDPNALIAMFTGDNAGAMTFFDPNVDGEGYEDSTQTINALAQWKLDAANDIVGNGHTISADTTAVNLHSARTSDTEYTRPTQDVVTIDNAKLGGNTIINTDGNADYDEATGEFTIKGQLETQHSDVEDSDITGAVLYILGNSTDENDTANKVNVNADGSFEYKVHLAPDTERSIALIAAYQIDNGDGTYGELHTYRNTITFVVDQDEPTLTIAGIDDLKQDADGNYLLETSADSFNLQAGIGDNADDYTLTVNGDKVFRQVVGGEPYLVDNGSKYGETAYTQTIKLADGTNFITITGADQFGNTTTKVLKITRVDATSTTADSSSNDATAEADNQVGYAEGYREGTTGAQLKDLTGKTAAYLQGFTTGYNAGAADRNAKLAAKQAVKTPEAKAGATQPAAADADATTTIAGTDGSDTPASAQSALPQMGEAKPSSLGAMIGVAMFALVNGLFAFSIKRKH